MPKGINIWSVIIVGFVITALAFTACKKATPICYEPSDVRALIKYQTRTIVDTTIDSTGVDTTFIRYADTGFEYLNALSVDVDSPIIIYASSGSSGTGLFLDPNHSQTKYYIRFTETDALVDTLIVYHTQNLFSFPMIAVILIITILTAFIMAVMPVVKWIL